MGIRSHPDAFWIFFRTHAVIRVHSGFNNFFSFFFFLYKENRDLCLSKVDF